MMEGERFHPPFGMYTIYWETLASSSLRDLAIYVSRKQAALLEEWVFFPCRFLPFGQSIYKIFFAMLYYLYVTLPLGFLKFMWCSAMYVCKIFARRSNHCRFLVIHVSEILQIINKFWNKAISLSLRDLADLATQTIGEILFSWGSAASKEARNLSITELSELLAYEEFTTDEQLPENAQNLRRMQKVMHRYVPLNPFKATVRLKKMSATSPSDSTTADMVSEMGSVADGYDPHSPASFPPTPFSRARVLLHSSDRVNSMMFLARDQLRMEAQTCSRDPHSRKAAHEARRNGQLAAFDPRQTSDGLALTCGNHCLMKVGRGMCSSARSMIPVMRDAYVYMEFSVTASCTQIPVLAVGVSPQDSPLNVMVGSWPRSVGICSDGKLLVGSEWYKVGTDSEPCPPLLPGSTVGMLLRTGKSHRDNMDGVPETETEHEISKNVQMDGGFTFSLTVNINGVVREIPQGALFDAFADDLTAQTQLFPTVSLLSSETRVWCRFCEVR
jgi:hypothetical protein